MAEKIEYLDGLRGLAALVVVFTHFAYTFYPALVGAGTTFHIGPIETWIAASPFNLFFRGSFAVCIFFVLSGFVLTHKFFKTKNREVIVSSAMRRYLRLFFPIAFVIIAAYLMMCLNIFHNQQVSDITGSIWNKQFWTFNQDILGMTRQAVWDTLFTEMDSATSYDYVLWTMNVEFFGSLIAFAYVMLFGQTRNRWLVYIVAAVFFLNTYYLAFILGVLLADLYNKEKSTFKLDNTIALLALLLIGLYLGSYTGGITYPGYDIFKIINPLVTTPGLFYNIIGAFILLFVVLNSPWLKKLLSTNVSRLLGKLSFSVYLIHPLVLGSISSILFLFICDYLSYNVAAIVVLLVTVVAVMVSAYFVYRFVDEPGTRLSKTIYERYFTGESKPVKWKDAGKRITAFIGKNVAVFIILDIVLILLTGSVVFVIKPEMDRSSIEQNKIAYYEYHDHTINSYRNVSTYGKFNGSSVGSYKNWINGYETCIAKFFSDYNNMKNYGNVYMPYANATIYESIGSDILYYGNLVNETQDNYNNYKSVYNEWYWNDTVPVV